jgi:thiol-disulfide isomerase/thioredoxin
VSVRDRRRPLRRGRRRRFDQGWWIRMAAIAVAVVLAGAIVVALRYGSGGLPGTAQSSQSLPSSGPLAPDFTGIVDWENSSPLTMDSLRGKVVLVDFWTYSCINCQRTFPFLRQWWIHYQADGLVIVGVHSPEFTFEKDVGNVRRAIKDYGITWPVAVDSNMATWNAFNNQYWPAEYLIDAGGHVRRTNFGEGDYATTERDIQALLTQSGHKWNGQVASGDAGITADAQAETPETYVGSDRSDGSVAFQGAWSQQTEYEQLTAVGAQGSDIASLPYKARRVYMVAAPAAGPVTVRVTLDGHDLLPSQAGAGVHVDASGRSTVVVDHDDLYALVSLPDFSQHLLQLMPEQPGFQLYTFTFGS